MRHYFGYTAEGRLATIEFFHQGWPDKHALDNPSCSDWAQQFRTKTMMQSPFVVDFIAYTCPCTGDNCEHGCCSAVMAAFRVDLATKTLVEKPDLSMLIDGVACGDGKPVTRAPGERVELTLSAPDMPDETEVIVGQSPGIAVMLEDSLVLKFSAGEAGPVQLTAPAQGMSGVVATQSTLWIRPKQAILRGFA